jgi:hypothetical protein
MDRYYGAIASGAVRRRVTFCARALFLRHVIADGEKVTPMDVGHVVSK